MVNYITIIATVDMGVGMKYLPILLFLLLFVGCGQEKQVVWIPKQTPKKECKYRYKVNGKTYCVLKNHTGYVETGVASWYGPGFHGQRTASGEIYNMYKLTAAHRTLPLGTYVKVINLENGKDVVVRVNDRGPFVRGRIIDLSYAAAKQIGMLRKGTARVRLIALGKMVGNNIKPVNYTTGKFYVQVGAFSNKLNAYRMMHNVKRKYSLSARVVRMRGYYRVIVGPKGSYAEAKQLKAHLRKLGLKGSFVIELE